MLKSLSKKTLMWLVIVGIMLGIFIFWTFSLKYHFSKTKPASKEADELRKIQREFGQIFSGFKGFVDENVAPALRPDQGEASGLSEKEIEELRKKIFLPIRSPEASPPREK